MRRLVASGLAVLAVLMVGACGGRDDADLRIMVPNAPGSGYDTTARTVAKALEDARVAPGVEVFNLPGAGGCVGLQRLVYEAGNPSLVMLMGLGIVGAQYTNRSEVTLADTTPIARLLEEPAALVVTRDSPIRTVADLIARWRQDPPSVRVGGGSTVGGPDHLALMLVARALGIPSVAYVRHDGGGELLAALLGRQVELGVSGLGEYADQIRSGELRVLALTAAKRVSWVDAPTLTEVGVDVVFSNWRGIVAPPGLTPEALASLRERVDRLHASPEWRAAVARHDWIDSYLTGDAFAAFVSAETRRVEDVLNA